jgi:hypothetical protein
MPLPPRVFFTLHETASRWGCTIADLADWASAGKFDIITGIPGAMCGKETFCGKVTISPLDVLPVFRRHGPSPSVVCLMRIKPEGAEDWALVTEPRAGIAVSVADLLISAEDVRRFEDDHNLLRRTGGGTGSITNHDWEGMYLAVIRRIHERGLPATQTEFVEELQDWFVEMAENGVVPDESTIRRRLRPIWRALRGDN